MFYFYSRHQAKKHEAPLAVERYHDYLNVTRRSDYMACVCTSVQARIARKQTKVDNGASGMEQTKVDNGASGMVRIRVSTGAQVLGLRFTHTGWSCCLVFETRYTRTSEISCISFANTMLLKEDHPATRGG